MRHIAAVCVLLALLTAPVAAKGPTTRIVIKDIERGSVSEITDRAVVDQFQIWSGEGTYSGPPDRTTEGTQGFIVDWQGYLYFPGRSDEHFRLNVRSIHRGVEGQWLRANHAWQTAMGQSTGGPPNGL
jgi:hypothetical protein